MAGRRGARSGATEIVPPGKGPKPGRPPIDVTPGAVPPASPPTGATPTPALGPSQGPPPTLAEAVAEINRRYIAGALATALDIARYVHLQLLSGDRDRLALGLEEPTLRELSRTPGLKVSAANLSVILNVYLQLPLLDEKLARSLSLSHHRLLLGIEGARDKNRFAARAVERDLAVRDLAEEVRVYRLKHHLPPIGRPPEEPSVKASRRLAATALAFEQTLDGHPERQPWWPEVLTWHRLAERRLERIRARIAELESRPKPR